MSQKGSTAFSLFHKISLGYVLHPYLHIVIAESYNFDLSPNLSSLPARQTGQQSMLDSVTATDRNKQKQIKNNAGHFVCCYQIYTDPWLVRRGIDFAVDNICLSHYSQCLQYSTGFGDFEPEGQDYVGQPKISKKLSIRS